MIELKIGQDLGTKHYPKKKKEKKKKNHHPSSL